jgi:hypothetical protein
MLLGTREETIYCAGTLLIALLVAALPTLVRLAPTLIAIPPL